MLQKSRCASTPASQTVVTFEDTAQRVKDSLVIDQDSRLSPEVLILNYRILSTGPSSYPQAAQSCIRWLD